MPKPKADDDFDQMMERRRQAKHAFRVDITIGYLLVVVVAAGALFLLYNFVQNTRAEIRQAKELSKQNLKSALPQSYRQPILLGPDAAVPTKTTPATQPSARMESEPQIKGEPLPKLPPLKEPELPPVKPNTAPKTEPYKRPMTEPDDGFPIVRSKSPTNRNRNSETVDLEVQAFARKLANESVIVRLNAIRNLAKQGAGAAKFAGPLCNALLDTNAQVKTAAIQTIELIRPDLYEPLTQLMIDATLQNQIAGCNKLSEMGEKALPAITLLLTLQRREFAKGPLRSNGVGEVVAIERNGILTQVQILLIETINNIDQDNPAILEIYKQTATEWCLKGYDCTQIVAPIFAWAEDEVERRKYMLPFLKAVVFSDKSYPAYRLKCIAQVGEYGPLAKDFVPILRKLKLSPDAVMREAASKALDKIQKP